MDVQIDRATFVGRRGRDEITFACVSGARYAILRNGVAIGVWGRTDYAYCLGIYLRMIDRPAAPAGKGSRAATLSLPRRPGPPVGVSAKAS